MDEVEIAKFSWDISVEVVWVETQGRKWMSEVNCWVKVFAPSVNAHQSIIVLMLVE